MYEIKPSPGKGLGVFATEHIPGGTEILVEGPIFALEEPTAIRIYRKFIFLPPALQQEYLSLTMSDNAEMRSERHDSAAPNPIAANKRPSKPSEPSKLEQYAEAIAKFNIGQDALVDPDVVAAAKVVAIFVNNAFTIRDETETRTLFGIFMELARINHSILPNSVSSWNRYFGRTVDALRDIEAGEEITISYTHGVLDVWGSEVSS